MSFFFVADRSPLLLTWFQGTGGIPFWEFGGNAMVTDEAVRLTDAQQSRKGWIWNSQVRFGVQDAWIIDSPRKMVNPPFFGVICLVSAKQFQDSIHT